MNGDQHHRWRRVACAPEAGFRSEVSHRLLLLGHFEVGRPARDDDEDDDAGHRLATVVTTLGIAACCTPRSSRRWMPDRREEVDVVNTAAGVLPAPYAGMTAPSVDLYSTRKGHVAEAGRRPVAERREKADVSRRSRPSHRRTRRR